ncbi:MAG: hypothetical protein ABIP54_01235, partial [Candidatus Andersenbacteria bacterium]
MKRSELFFGAMLVPIDYIMLLAAAAAAYYVRLSPAVRGLRPVLFEVDLPLPQYMQLASIVSIVVILVFAAQ